MSHMVRKIAALAVLLASLGVEGCVGTSRNWYETHFDDVVPSGRTLEYGPYQLAFKDRAIMLVDDLDAGKYLTPETRRNVAKSLSIPEEEVCLGHLAWYLHRGIKSARGHTYAVKIDCSGSGGECTLASWPFQNLQRELFDPILEGRKAVFRGENRKKLPFCFFVVRRETGEPARNPRLSPPADAEWTVCLLGKGGYPVKTIVSRVWDRDTVEARKVPGARPVGRAVDVRLGNETVNVWNPPIEETSNEQGRLLGALLIQALNEMSEDELLALEPETP